MWLQIGKILIFFISGLLLAILNFSLSSALPGLSHYINPGLIVLTFILFFLNIKPSLLFTLFFGITLDILSFEFFPIYTISLALAVLALNFILQNFLTNKSLYALLATIIGFTLVYNTSLALLDFIFSVFSHPLAFSLNAFWLKLVYETAWGLLFAFLFFHPLIIWFKKFKPFFLEKAETI